MSPNILFLFPDQWRWDWLGCEDSPYGKVPVRTPHLDALAARGMRFAQCRTNSPVCAPARAALVTGLRYERCGVPGNGVDLSLESDTYLQRLRAAGYRVAASGKTDLQKHGQWKGLDGWTEAMGRLGFTECCNQAGKWDAVQSGWPRPQDPYMKHLHESGCVQEHVADYQRRREFRQNAGGVRQVDSAPSPLPREHHTDDFCGRAACEFLSRWSVDASGRSPWHLWVNFPGPHEPFDPPAELLEGYAGVEFPLPVGTPQRHIDHQAVRRSYAAMIRGIDEWVGRILGEIKRRGETDRTLIVFSSDHGEMLGDHGKWFKQVPEEGSVHVPLIVAGPGVRQGVSGTPVELIDLAATMLDWAGVAAPAGWDARSLGPVLRGESRKHRDVTLCSLGAWKMAFDGRWKLIFEPGKADRLYDLSTDPAETKNLADGCPDEVSRLKKTLP